METLVQKVLSYGETIPDKPAVCFKNTVVSYGKLCSRIRGIAAELREMGIKREDRVMLSAVSKPEYIAALLGIQYLGAIAVPADKSAKVSNITELWELSQARLFLADGKKLPDKVRIFSLKKIYEDAEDLIYRYAQGQDFGAEIQISCHPEESQLCEILFTTGTTGRPKGVMLSYRCIYTNMLNTWHGIGMLPSDVVLNPLPLNHSFGMRVLRATLFIGATLVLQNGFTFAKEIENNVRKFSCTAMVSVPASMELIHRQMQDKFAAVMRGLRYLEFGAGSVSVDLKKKLLEELPDTRLFNTWGSTETGGALFLDITAHPDKLASIGKPIDGVELKTVDQEGRQTDAVDINTAGRMVLRGAMQMEGYWGAEDLTRQTIIDGWLYTGDMVYRDADGFVYMLGRADDIINVGGEKVSPIEVENIAGEYAGVAECACIGVPDPEKILGFIPALYYVVSGTEFRLEDFKEYLYTRLERYKVPQEFIQVAELPRNSMKKLDRRSLRSLWDSHGRESLINPVVQTILTRRSIRKFTDRQIPREILEVLIKAGYHAPSGHNMQTWKFTVVQTPETIAHIKEVMEKTARENEVYFYGFENPVCLILVSNDERNPYGCQDASCAAENIMLAAHSYGVGSVWINALMKLRDAEPAKTMLDELHIPKNHIVWSTIALGYPTAEGVLLAKKADVVEWL